MIDDARESAELNEPAANASQRRPAYRTAMITGAAIVLAATGFGLFAMFVPTPPVPTGMLTATAGEDGYRQEGKISDDPLIAATATGLQSRCGVMASSSISHSGGDRLFDRTLAICNSDDDLLMQRIGLALFENLRDTGRFEQVRYLPADQTLPEGERLPEIFVILKNTAWKESGLPGNREYEGEFLVTASDRYLRSSHGYHNTLSPPHLQFRWRAEINYTATQTGIETSGARYQALSRDLAGEIAERLTKFLDDAAEKYGAAGEVPEFCYPAYVPPPQFDFLAGLKAEKLVDGPAFMRHAVTVWQTPQERIPREVVALVRDSLDEAGWKVPDDEQHREYLRATNGEQVLVVFRENDSRGLADRDADSKERVFLVYTRSMSTDEMDAAVQRLFAEEADEQALVMFQNHWYRHRDAVEAYFEKRPPTDSASWLQLARFRKKKDPDAARDALLRATALQWIYHQDAPDSSMKKLAEELGIEKLPSQVSPEVIETLHVASLDAPGEVTLTARDQSPAAIWLGVDEQDDEQVWLLLTISDRGQRTGQTLEIQHVTLGEGTWSRSEQSRTKPSEPAVWEDRHTLSGGEAIEIACQPGEDDGTYELTLHRTPNK